MNTVPASESVVKSPLHPNFPHRLLGYVIVFDTASRKVNSLPIASGFQGAVCVRSSDGSEARIAPHETIIGFTPCPDVGWKDDRGLPPRRRSRELGG